MAHVHVHVHVHAHVHDRRSRMENGVAGESGTSTVIQRVIAASSRPTSWAVAWLTTAVFGGILALLVTLFAPNGFAGSVTLGAMLFAHLCGWRSATAPTARRALPVFASLALGAVLATYQHYRGLALPGHWFERGADYSLRTTVEIRHDKPGANTYVLAADVQKRAGEYQLTRVYFRNGGQVHFVGDTRLASDPRQFSPLTSSDDRPWRARLKSD
jgi:hypothetical protein